MAVTVKKNTLKLKRPAQEEAPQAEAAVEEAATPASASGGGMPAWPAILALAATILFGVLLALQFMELSYYKAPPSVWPGPGYQGTAAPMPAEPAPEPEPVAESDGEAPAE